MIRIGRDGRHIQEGLERSGDTYRCEIGTVSDVSQGSRGDTSIKTLYSTVFQNLQRNLPSTCLSQKGLLTDLYEFRRGRDNTG
jgi:hypothetical protein